MPEVDRPALDSTADRCPICQRRQPVAQEFRRFLPFCSRRCQQVDLMRWLDGRYAIVEELACEDDGPTQDPAQD